jgi:DNA mismatch endonuclease (patch repair protein)
MRATPNADTRPEIRLRSQLHRCGLRFRKNYVIRTPARVVRTDIAFPGKRVAIFVDGCFWHGCGQHCRYPQSNAAWWLAKIARNRERDLEVNSALSTDGWRVLRVWEHEDPFATAQRVLRELADP